MGLRSFLGLKPPKKVPPVEVTARPIWDFLVSDIESMSIERLWREQPYLRTVVGFLARSVASVGIHTLVRKPEGGRERVRDSELARLMRQPNPQQTMYEFIYGLVADLALYDEAYVAVLPVGDDVSARWVMKLIPPSWVVARVADKFDPFAPVEYQVRPGADAESVAVPEENMLYFHGWNPVNPLVGDSPVNALRKILMEQIHAQIFRNQKWTNGGRVNSYITRPAGATWTPQQRGKFVESFRKYSGSSSSYAGSVPILEDGMEMKSIGFSSHEEEFVDASKLALSTVAAVYHVNPTMVGLLDNANYSNVREFRRMLYGDTLAPIIKQIEEKFNAFLVPKVDANPYVYVEFNLAEKMRGSFEEQASVLQSAVGRPYMKVNEAREMQNLPHVEGGDEIYIPLNMGTAEDFAAPNEEFTNVEG